LNEVSVQIFTSKISGSKDPNRVSETSERKAAMLVKISVSLSWNFSWKVFTAGQTFTRLT